MSATTLAYLQQWLELYHDEQGDLEQVDETDDTYGLVIPKATGTVVVLIHAIQFYPGDEWNQGELPQREVKVDLTGPTGYRDVAFWLQSIAYVFDAEQREQFVEQYVVTMLWSESATGEDGESFSLDERYDESRLSEELSAEVITDCENFLNFHGHELYAARITDRNYNHVEQGAHDFALTRNRHGAGFWDRGLWTIGDRLTAAAHLYGSSSWYVGDDERIYSC